MVAWWFAVWLAISVGLFCWVCWVWCVGFGVLVVDVCCVEFWFWCLFVVALSLWLLALVIVGCGRF